MSVRTRKLEALQAEALQAEIKELDVETGGEEQVPAHPASVLPSATLRCRLEPLLEGAGLARSTFYRRKPAAVPSSEASTGKAPQKKRGRRPKTWILTDDGAAKSTGEVVETIEDILSGEFVIYGYAKVQKELCKRGIAIGRKKTYRLMKDHALLTGTRRARPETERQFVRVRTVKAERPFEHVQMDIKQIYLQSEDRLAFVLTLEDTFSRAAIAQTVKYSMLSDDSVALLKDAQTVWSQASPDRPTTLRTDNGSQFIAQSVRAFVSTQKSNLVHEFCHKATPQENGFIESFHSIMEHEVVRRYEFATLGEAQEILKRHTDFYNHRRLHGTLGYMTPMEKLEQYWHDHPTEKPTHLPSNLVPFFRC